MQTAFARRVTRALSSLVLGVLFAALFPFAASAAEIRRAEEPVAGRYIVTVSPMTADVAAAASELAKTYDGEVLTVWRHAVKGFWIRISAANAEKLARDKRVVAIEEDALVHASGSGERQTGAQLSSTDPIQGITPKDGIPKDAWWHLTRISHRDTSIGHPVSGGSTRDPYYRYRWSNDGIETNGDRVTVYLIDTGVQATHREFTDNTRPAGSRRIEPGHNAAADPDGVEGVPADYVPPDSSSSDDPCRARITTSVFAFTDNSISAHGTATASMVVGKYVGVADGVVVVSVNTTSCEAIQPELAASVAMLIGGVDEVLRDITANPGKLAVVSISTFRPTLSGGQAIASGLGLQVLEQAFVALTNAGIPVVASANNQDADACAGTPARLSRRGGMRDQSGNPTRVITVGGTEPNDSRWVSDPRDNNNPGSNFGPCVDIWAPAFRLTVASVGGAYRVGNLTSGTSYAAPMVAGIVARIRAERPELTVDEIWDALEVNATRLNPTGLKLERGSPRLLAYIGSLLFTKQPESQVIAAGGSATLSAEVNIPTPVPPAPTVQVSYKWYRGGYHYNDAATPIGTDSSITVCTAPSTCAQQIGAAGDTFWVRVSRSDLPGHYADSNLATIKLGDCAPPKITEQPKSIWRMRSGDGDRKLIVSVQSSVPYCYQWEVATPNAASFTPVLNVEGSSGHSLSGPPPPFDAPDPSPSGDPASPSSLFYRFVAWSQPTAASCSVPVVTEDPAACEVASDTVQVRSSPQTTVAPFAQTSLDFDSNTSTGLNAVATNALAFTWLWSSSATTGFEALRRDLNEGWQLYHDARLVPFKQGYYRVWAENDNGYAETANSVFVRSVCDFDLRGQSGYGGILVGDANDEVTINAPASTTQALQITVSATNAKASAELSLRRPTFRWDNGSVGNVASGDLGLTNNQLRGIPQTCDREFTVTATDDVGPDATFCRRTLKFKVDIAGQGPCTSECLTLQPTFDLMTRQCALLRQDINYYAYTNGDVFLQPFVFDLTGATLPTNGFTFEWTVHRSNGTTEVIRTTDMRVPYRTDGTSATAVLTVDLIAKRTNECRKITINVLSLGIACGSSGCIKGCGRRPAVRHLGVPIETLSAEAGQQYTLDPPEVQPGWTFEWHQDTPTTPDVVFSTAVQATIAPTTDGTYYAVTLVPGVAPEESANLYVTMAAASTVARVTPAVQTVEAGLNATLHASVTGVTLDQTTIYEWRRGPDYDETAPVIPNGNSDQSVLTVSTPLDDVTYWCLIKHGGESYQSNIATIMVSCSGVDGSIVVKPVSRQVARGQLPRISAIGHGKLLTYEWRRTTPDSTNSYFAYGAAIMPSVSHATTYFGAIARDACGTTNDFGEVAIYLCVPTIDEQPAPHTIVAPDGVDAQGSPVGSAALTIDASPAIAGQEVDVTWHRSGYNNGNGNPVVGQGATVTVSVAAGTSATFYAIVSSPCADSSDSAVYSEPATIEVCAKPVITGQSPNRNIVDGNATSIVVVATGNALTYQWYVGQSGDTSSPLNGRTDSSLEITPTNTTSYWCRITSRGICVTDSATITVNLCWTPVITAQPQSKRIFGGSTVLSIGVDAGFNAQPITYQWQRLDSNGWANIASATTPTYTTPSLTTQTTYRVQLVVGACFVASEEATVSICTYPEIIEANPVETRTTVGQEVTLRVIASPVLDRIIRWYEGESGDTSLFAGGGYINSSLTVSPTVTKKYWAAIEYDGCVSRTTTYTVRVCRPTITTQPAGSSITQSQSATLSVGTSNLAGQTFQWYTGASGTTTSPVAGQTSSTLTVTPSGTTSYWVRVAGTCDVSQDSDAATVTVCVPPVISSTNGPVVPMRSGESRDIQVNSSGTDRTFKWYVGQPGNIIQPIANSNDSSITVNPSATTSYWARVTSIGLCSTDSGSITVDVCALPVFSVQPQSQTSFSGNALILTAAAPSSTGAVTYQWYQGVSGTTTTPIPGATSATVTVSPTTQTSYWVRATTSICEADSDTATIDMCVYPEVVVPSPAEKLIEYGASATLSIPVMSPAGSKYVTWYRGAVGDRTTIVGGGINASFNTPALTTTSSYWAEITHNTCVSRMTAVTVRVCKPTITAQPAGATIQPGQSNSLTVGTAALAGQTVQWYTGAPGNTSSSVSGGTSTTVSVNPTVTTSYWVRVTGTCGTYEDSAAATITVCNPPVIGSVSPTRSIVSGSSTPINTNATGSNLTYKWYIGASGTTTNPVANSSTSGITVSPGATTSYWAQIKSEGLCVTNGPAILVDVCTTPVITTQPQTQTIRIGQPASLSVATTAAGATYQWYQGAPGTTTTPLGTTAAISVSPTDDVQYWVRITRGACSIDSDGATVTVCKLTASVANVNAASGQSATLAATVTNARASLTHWWYRGNTGDTSVLVDAGYRPQITVSRTATTNYWVRVTDGTCTIDSGTATLNICVPTISTQPQSVVVMTGQSTTLTVAATGSPLTYQWYAGDSGVTTSPIGGATSASYTTPTLTTETRYWVRVSGCSAANSNAAVVTVCIPPSTPSAPTKSGGAYPTNSATLSISATGTGLTYQWYKGPSGDTTRPISGATGATYNFTLSVSEYYWVRVTGTCGTPANSSAILYSVTPAITAQPQNTSVPSGSSVTFSVTATGNFITYQWYLGPFINSPISGATSSTLVTGPVTTNTTYWVKVSSGTTSANSAQAVASPCAGPSVYLTAQPLGAHNWKLMMHVSNEADIGLVRYQWYIGTPGNVAQSTPQGDGWGPYYKYVYNVTTPQTWWVRAWYVDDSCYTDTSGATIN